MVETRHRRVCISMVCIVDVGGCLFACLVGAEKDEIVELAVVCHLSAFALDAGIAAIKLLAGKRRVLVIPIERNRGAESCVDRH